VIASREEKIPGLVNDFPLITSANPRFYIFLTTFAYFLETPLLKLEVYREDCTDAITNDDKAVSREMV